MTQKSVYRHRYKKQTKYDMKLQFKSVQVHTRRGMRRLRKGEATLHCYHRSIWLPTECDLELPSVEMPVSSKQQPRYWRMLVFLGEKQRGRR
jgi:hypothetical protein